MLHIVAILTEWKRTPYGDGYIYEGRALEDKRKNISKGTFIKTSKVTREEVTLTGTLVYTGSSIYFLREIDTED